MFVLVDGSACNFNRNRINKVFQSYVSNKNSSSLYYHTFEYVFTFKQFKINKIKNNLEFFKIDIILS